KELRWTMEKTFGEFIGGEYFSRNQLLNESVEIYADKSRETTDILHEYFVPHDALKAFLARARDVVGAHPVDLLNVTVRDVRADQDTILRYATSEMLALVMLFSQARTDAGEASMEEFTRAMVDAVLEAGGTYYLPYRLHPTVDQFRRAYPTHKKFFAAKRRHDPGELFQNGFYARYGH
ncbi:MAG TPA: FAD-binding oxidoreductase, partial [Planctomycetes bacterium]|nr:FAD-binding oxidoreductase [Planctomycetota bacterium]